MNAKFPLVAELIAEFLGTFVLILLGTGVVAMVVLFPSHTPGEIIHGGYTNITLGWGLAVTMGIYVAGKISGAARSCPTRSRKLREHSWRRRSCIKIIYRPSTRSTRNWKKRLEFSRRSLPFRPCCRQDFWTR